MGAMLSSVLLNKLPPDVHLIVSRKVSSMDLDMDSLYFKRSKKNWSRESEPHIHLTLSHVEPKTEVDTPHQRKIQESGTSVTCCYCQQSHSSTDCSVIHQLSADIYYRQIVTDNVLDRLCENPYDS